MTLQRFVIVLTTRKGEFYWDGTSKFDLTGDMKVKRTFGWVNTLKEAQLYHNAHAANAQAISLTTDLGRLFDCGIHVRCASVDYTEGVRQAQFADEQPANGEQPGANLTYDWDIATYTAYGPGKSMPATTLLDRAGTHWDGCYTAGTRHWNCAVGEAHRQRARAERAEKMLASVPIDAIRAGDQAAIDDWLAKQDAAWQWLAEQDDVQP